MGGNPTIFQGSMDSHQFPRESRSHAHITWPLQKLIVKEDVDFVSFWDGTGAYRWWFTNSARATANYLKKPCIYRVFHVALLGDGCCPSVSWFRGLGVSPSFPGSMAAIPHQQQAVLFNVDPSIDTARILLVIGSEGLREHQLLGECVCVQTYVLSRDIERERES